VHPDRATVAALAACAAAAQGKFAEMEHLIWEKGFAAGDLSSENMQRLAAEAKLDRARFEADLIGQDCTRRVTADQEQLGRFGVNGTPAFFINGRFLGGAQPLGEFKRLIDEELAKAEAKIAGGVPVADYYRVAVLEAGLASLAPAK
jgi:protein-disulfide isomerase